MKLYLRILFFLLLLSQVCSAQWVQTGPSGGIVHGIRSSFSSLYAATYGGVLVSTDLGISWSHSNWGLTDGNVTAVAASNTYVYAGTLDHGVFVKDINGSIWTPTSLNNQRITCLAIFNTYVVAGTYSAGVFLSTNNGTTWNQVNNGLTDYQIKCFEQFKTTLFAGTGSKVFQTTNFGTTWTETSTGLPNTIIQSLAINGSTMYAGVWGSGIYASPNFVQGWIKLGTSPRVYIYQFAFNGSDIYVAAQKVYLSTTDGTDWTDVSGDIPAGAQIQSVTYLNGNLIAGDNAVNGSTGIYVSANGGTNWTSITQGLPNYCTNSITANNGWIFTGTSGGVFLTTDGGANWRNPSLPGFNQWADLSALAHRGSNYVFAGDVNGNVYVSSNMGQNFTIANLVEAGASIASFAFSGTNVFASTKAWASGSPNAVYMSGDNGATWNSVSTGLPQNSYISSLAVIGTNLFAATGNGVYLSTNEGTSWTQVNNGLTGTIVRSLAVKGAELFAGTSMDGVFRTSNNGTNWTQTSLVKDIQSLFVVDTNLFAGGQGGIYYMINSNSTWKSIGLSNVSVTGFAADNGILYASTLFNSVWKRPIAEILTDVKDQKQIPDEFNLFQNYPNPFNPSTTIAYSVLKSGFVVLKVYNIMGKELETLVNEQKGAGNYEVKFDAGNLASGVYFYQLKSGNLVSTRKLVLLK